LSGDGGIQVKSHLDSVAISKLNQVAIKVANGGLQPVFALCIYPVYWPERYA
jgi:hypothetical protein